MLWIGWGLGRGKEMNGLLPFPAHSVGLSSASKLPFQYRSKLCKSEGVGNLFDTFILPHPRVFSTLRSRLSLEQTKKPRQPK